MRALFSLSLTLLSLASSPSTRTEAQGIRSSRLLDLLIRDYSFRSFDKFYKTGEFHSVRLPANLSGVGTDTARFRCGSLRRYGAQVKEFHLGVGLIVQPCIERVMVVRQNLGYNLSSIYYDNYDLSGYELVSPVLGLLAYNGGDDMNLSNPFEIGIEASKKNPILIDFKNITLLNQSTGLIPLCARFEHDGKVFVYKEVSPSVCSATSHGHFGMVVESPLLPERKVVRRWKLVVGCSIGAALGAFLLSLLVVALFVKVKKKARMDEMVRRAYEEEALRVTMVGHVRAPVASGTRTTPVIEHQYKHFPS